MLILDSHTVLAGVVAGVSRAKEIFMRFAKNQR